MKRLSIALAGLLSVAAPSFGQGTIYFNTRVVGVVDAPIVLPLAGGVSPGPNYSAQLFLVGTAGSLTPLVPATTFRSGTSVNQEYVVPVDTVIVPGVPAGGSATIQMGVWKTSLGSFEAAKAAAQAYITAPVLVDNLGGGPLPPANLTGRYGSVQGLLVFPEPSTIALGVLGGALVLLLRRK